MSSVDRKIAEVCEVIAGQSPEGKFYNSDGNGMPFYQGKKEFTEKFLGKPTTWTTKVTKEAVEGDILMSVRAPVGPVNFSTQRICIGRGLAAIRVSDKIEKEYLFYFLLKHESEITGNAGAVFNSINKTQIGNIILPIPPLLEQQQIVALLDEAFAAIDQAKANIEKNIQNARDIFESQLNIKMVEILEGQNSTTLNELCDLIVDCEHKTAPLAQDGYPSIRTPNIGKGNLILEGVNRVSYETYIAWTRRAVPQAGDLILAREAPAGNIAVIPENIEVCLGQRTVLLRTKNDMLIPKYLAYLILSKDVQNRLLSHSTGATVQHINMKDIRAFRIGKLISLQEQKNIVSQLEELQQFSEDLESLYNKRIKNLEELKKSILQKAFAGELTSIKTVSNGI
jgi:type I restriction enzyme S subunit